MTQRDATRLLAGAIGVLACQLVLSVALIPPWQHPDEHAHVAVVQVWRERLAGGSSTDPGRQGEILKSMAAEDWWRHYGVPAPTPLPTTFQDGGGAANTLGTDPTSTGYPRPYYVFVASALSLGPRGSVVHDLYAMRALSAALALLTLYVAWRGTREWVGETGGATVAALLALHPQFALVSTTAGPDAVVNLFGAAIWWQASRAMGERRLWPLAAIWGAALAAAVVDRMGAPLLVSAFMISLVAVMRRRIGGGRLLGMLVVLAVLLAGTSLWLRGVEQTLPQSITALPLSDALDWNYFLRFSSSLFASWWASFGWARYWPPWWWTAVAACLALGAAVGGIRLVSQRSPHVPLVAMALMMVGIQIAAVYWTYFRLGQGAQGRYLFPSLVPSLVLLWMGTGALTDTEKRRYVALVLIITLAFLEIVAWHRVAIPAYLT